MSETIKKTKEIDEKVKKRFEKERERYLELKWLYKMQALAICSAEECDEFISNDEELGLTYKALHVSLGFRCESCQELFCEPHVADLEGVFLCDECRTSAED